MLRIAIVDPSDATREPLRAMLLGVDFVWLEAESKQYEFFGDVISRTPRTWSSSAWTPTGRRP